MSNNTPTEGMAGLMFVQDITKLLKDEWKPTNTDGKKPEFVKTWETKEVGHGDSNYRKILISLDSETPNIFSLRQTDSDGNSFYDWLHDVSVTIDIRTGESEKTVEKLANEVVRILKRKVVPVINNRYYVQILPGPIVPFIEDYRNLYRYTIDCDALRWNP